MCNCGRVACGFELDAGRIDLQSTPVARIYGPGDVRDREE
jgi:hypothetical protein